MTGKVHTLAPQSSAVRDPERHTSAVALVMASASCAALDARGCMARASCTGTPHATRASSPPPWRERENGILTSRNAPLRPAGSMVIDITCNVWFKLI